MACLARSSYHADGSTAASANDRFPVSEEDLVAEARTGDGEAFDELCRRHAQQVLRVTERITRNREDAEDALQDSFLSAFVHIRNFDGRSRFSTWMTRIAINSALMLLRRNRNSPAVFQLQGDDPDAESPWLRITDRALDPEVRCLKNEQIDALRVAIRSLRPRVRRVIELGPLQEGSVEETAELLGISVSAAKARTFHARAALRKSPRLQLLRPAGSNKHLPVASSVQRATRPSTAFDLK
jgi:RNA polymerase sigma factor (sigma-70 family)